MEKIVNKSGIDYVYFQCDKCNGEHNVRLSSFDPELYMHRKSDYYKWCKRKTNQR